MTQDVARRFDRGTPSGRALEEKRRYIPHFGKFFVIFILAENRESCDRRITMIMTDIVLGAKYNARDFAGLSHKLVWIACILCAQ
ncbi:hypothetical protein AAMO2058_000868200 [Amorphochlora amoebiformis]